MGYIRLDRVEDIVESIYCASDLENGAIVTMTGNMDTYGEAFEVAVATDVTDPLEKIMVHASVPLQYDETKAETDFVLEAGTMGRAYVLRKGNSIISISTDMFTGTVADIAVGDIVVPVNGQFGLEEDAVAGGGETVNFRVIDRETIGGGTVEVIVLQLL